MKEKVNAFLKWNNFFIFSSKKIIIKHNKYFQGKVKFSFKENTKLASTEAGTNSITEASKTLRDDLLHGQTEENVINIQYHGNPCFVNYQKKNEWLDVKQQQFQVCLINPKHQITQKLRIWETRQANCIINFKEISVNLVVFIKSYIRKEKCIIVNHRYSWWTCHNRQK